ncbi:MAG: thioester reductase [Pseudonocardia sp. SCN 73-27]|nr:carboxylic acid reductase [Pseudonocardia sp.]ODU29987.1 MAG: thioester reductase [Pseudonocardia sp. SCN 72-51]ODV08217.1 MAG: thioester reductase [Pseudonocardia sp. SCN 73-27]
MTLDPRALPAYARRVLDLAETDPQLRELMPDGAVEEALGRPDLSFEQALATVLDTYAERPALGERGYDIALGDSGRHVRAWNPWFRTITYGELHGQITGLASSWRHQPRHRVDPGDFVCVLGTTSIDFVTIDLACAFAHAVSVPLQGTMGAANLDRILHDTTPTTVAATVAELSLAAELVAAHPSVRSLVVIDSDERVDDEREAIEAAAETLGRSRSSAALVMLAELVARGAAEPWTPLPPAPEGNDRLALLVHSSGSTGTPKGAVLTERLARAPFSRAPVPVPVVRLCFAPMAHTAGRGSPYGALAHGGTAFFTARPDLSMLFEDMRLVRPTESFAFPRILEMVHRAFQGDVTRRVNSGIDPAKASADVMAEMRDTFLGDRISLLTVGGAPTPPALARFTAECLPVEISDRYGSTEVGQVTENGRIMRPPIIDYRLRDVPELGYHTTDEPYPRGELCLRTATAISGYFNRPDATAALFDEDGYLLTGDIMEERGPDHLVYVDRRHDVLKLSQGEFVAAGALRTAFEDGSDVIHQIYLYGTSVRSYLVAVVVPDAEAVRRVLGERPRDGALKELIRAELNEVGATAGLKAFEIPRDFLVEPEPFTHENDLLTSLHKPRRPNLERKYGGRLEALYDELERRQRDELDALRGGGDSLDVLEKIGRALEASLGLEHVDVHRPYGFTELGGDSLGAVAFSELLEDLFGVEVPVTTILSPAGNPVRWARAVEAALRHEGSPATFSAVHGRGTRELRAADLGLDAFLDADALRDTPGSEPPTAPRTVLLTGATGFLGRFLCLEWLEELAATGGTLVALVRAADEPAARSRLDAAFASDPALLERFRALARDRLRILPGDVAEPRLGLTARDHDRLADEVDRIVHPAALVNHVLGYESLFGPNVAGTAQLIGLALHRRQKRIDFVSSAAVRPFLDRSAGPQDEWPLSPQIVLTGRYGSGYGASKWAAELLLHDAHRRFGLPVDIHRGSMMLPHRHYRGQINPDDVFTRLLHSVITTGLAPRSFYFPGPDGSRARAHYDGLPVDFVAAAIVRLGAQAHRDVRTLHVSNFHVDDGYSLDMFVDWIEQAGYPIRRIDDHGEWLRLFEERLRALPEDERNRSSLAVLDSLRRPDDPSGRAARGTRFREALDAVPGGGLAPPHLTREFLGKCLDDMRRLGLLPAPA